MQVKESANINLHMDGVIKTVEQKEVEEEFSFKKLFVPLTQLKAIQWIIIIGLIVYVNMLLNGFVWDDVVFILNNTQVHTLNIALQFGSSLFNTEGYYRPIPALYFTILYSIFGEHPFFYHLFQLFFHITCSCLLFYILKQFLHKLTSFFLSLIFLIHPIQVESVVYIAQTISPLNFIFGITALLLSIKEITTIKRLFCIFGLLFLSLLTKETGILFILLVLLYKFLYKNKEFLLYSIFGISTTLLYLFVRVILAGVGFGRHMTDVPITRLSLQERLLSIPAIIYSYIKTVFFPLHLSIDQQWIVKTFDVYHFYTPLLIDLFFFLIIGLFGLYIFKKNKKEFRTFIFFFFWFLSGFLMIIQLIPLDLTVADRWFYFPLTGLLGIIGLMIQQIQKRRFTVVISAFAIVIIVLFSLRTILRNLNWSDSRTLYSHDIQIEDNYDLENNYGITLFTENEHTKALEVLLKANAMQSTETTLRNVGTVYLALRNDKLSGIYLEKAYHTTSYAFSHKHQVATYYTLARYYMTIGKPLLSKKITDIGIEDYPDSWDLWYIKALCEYLLNNKQGAIYSAQKAYAISPNDQTSSLYSNLVNNIPLNIQTNSDY